MKILYMTISYNPEGNGLYQNLVESLLKRGHDVTIVRSKYDVECTSYNKIRDRYKMLTIKTLNPFDSNLIKKGLNQISLSHYFKINIKKYLNSEKYDLILYATPPITLASVVLYCKKKYNAKTFLMLKDIFPQNAVDLGMFKKESILYKYFRKQEKKYYNYSDFIGCMSKGNKDYVLKHNNGICEDKVVVFPNSITIEEVEGLSFHNDKTVFMFGGNLGKPQNIPFLLNVINKLKNYDKAEFVIVGEGTEQNIILNFAKEESLANFKYIKQLPQKEYEDMLKSADVGIISLDYRFTIPNIPSRFQTYLKLKKPILAITDVNTDLRSMIQEHDCGWWCEATDEMNVFNMIKKICDNKDNQILKGENGRKFLEKEFDVEDNVNILERLMEE